MQYNVKRVEDFSQLPKMETGDSLVLFTKNAEPIVLQIDEDITVLNEEIFVVPKPVEN